MSAPDLARATVALKKGKVALSRRSMPVTPLGARHSPVCPCSRERAAATPRPLFLLVILLPQVRDLLFAHEPAQRVLQLGLLNEQVVLGVEE